MPSILRLLAVCTAGVSLSLTATAVAAPSSTFADAGERAVSTLLESYYAGGGMWRECDRADCRLSKSDWGVDSATGALYLRWSSTGGGAEPPAARALLGNAPRYPGPCGVAPCAAWSDTPAWDAVAAMREGEMSGDLPAALLRAEAALRYVTESAAFVGGACPAIPYQRASHNRVKTLETGANAVKAELLVFEATHDPGYLVRARTLYAAGRRYFLDPKTPLYTVHVLDDGAHCEQQAHRFFASVNGDMIWNGVELWKLTGNRGYHDEALATARAVAETLVDARGVFVDLGGENDVVEPLVEAMYELASTERLAFAREWILTNAAAALSSRAPDGSFARFFDGPPQTTASIWESNGGLALEIAAAALDPGGYAAAPAEWKGPVQSVRVTDLPATIAFTGEGIALVGTISANCERAHVRVIVDGARTFDETGLWQNHGLPGREAVRFAWRWKTSGPHTIALEPSSPRAAGPNAMRLSGVVLPASPASEGDTARAGGGPCGCLEQIHQLSKIAGRLHAGAGRSHENSPDP